MMPHQHLTQAAVRVRFEIYPEITLLGTSEPATWFELALHAEVDDYHPPGHPSSVAARFVLSSLADYLLSQLQACGPLSITRSETNTLHSEDAAGGPQVRISRTLSLVFSDVGPYTPRDEPALLTHLRAELDQLGVSGWSSQISSRSVRLTAPLSES